jgi:hypothetical protein
MGLRRAEAAISLPAMRLLRALTHLALALALIGLAVAPTRAIAFVPAQAAHHHMDHDAGVAAEHAAYDHGAPAGEHPAPDACQTLCCFIPSQVPPHGPHASAVEFFCPVRYMDAVQPGSGRTDAPDPGIPKLAV